MIEMLRSFFRFCETAEWIAKNPMRGIKPPQVTDVPTLPVSDADFGKLIDGARKLSVAGQRLCTLLLLLRYSGLRISDAISLTADRLEGDRLFLRQQKTGVFVYLPLPGFVASALRKEFAEHNRPFWRGRGAISSVIENWRRAAYTLAAHTAVRNFHFHRLRDSFAVSLLERGVDIETVAVLLGHSSSAVTRKHYNPWVESRQTALEAAVRRTWRSVA
jgi:integrase